jgi:hypothetical protein
MPRPSDLDRLIAAHVISPTGPTEEQLQHALKVELQKERARARDLEARVRHIEQALKTAGRVLQPYLSGTRG